MKRLLTIQFAGLILVAHGFAQEIYIPATSDHVNGKVEEYTFAEFEDFQIDLPKLKKKKVVNTSDFGADPDNKNNYRAFTDAIAKCKEMNASHLVIEPGVYYINTDKPLLFSELSDLTIEAKGAEFLFFISKIYTSGILIEHCSRLHFKDLVVDWDWKRAPIASLAEVIDCNLSEQYFDLKMNIKHPGDRGIYCLEPYDPDTEIIGAVEYGERGKWCFKKQQWLDKERLRIWLRTDLGVSVDKDMIGNTYRARYYGYDNYCFMYMYSEHITFDNICLYSVAGGAFSGAQDCHHVYFKNCKVTKRPGTDRIISCAVDQCMVRNAKGYFKWEGCDFGYGGDDPINIHARSHRGFEKIGPRTIKVTSPNTAALSWWTPFKVGDILDFRHGDLRPTGFSTTVTGVQWLMEEMEVRVMLSDMLPEYVLEDSFIFDQRWATRNYIIRNCHFHHNRARGVLAQAPNGIIENCIFEDLQGPAIKLEAGWEPRWSEGYGVQNLIIRNNTFRNCNLSEWKKKHGSPVIFCRTYISDVESAFPAFDGVVISGNVFEDVAGSLISVHSARRVIIEKNRFNSSRNRSRALMYSGSICLKDAGDVLIHENQWRQYEKTFWNKPGVILDSETVSNVKFTENHFRSM